MRRIFLSILLNILLVVFFITSFFLENSSRKNLYEGNSWGNLYYSSQDSNFYIDETSDYSTYRIKKDNYLYCSSNNKKSDKIFCWYVFDKNEMPIFGWVKIEDLEKR